MTNFGRDLMALSLDFAVKIAKLAKALGADHEEFVISRQIAKSGMSIGANIREALFAQSDADFCLEAE